MFVFGSNEKGVHTSAVARLAMSDHGAIWGVGEGRQGNSYGIPVKDGNLNTLPLNSIKEYIRRFVQFARTNSSLTFEVTRVGCGSEGYNDIQIAPLFQLAPKNCHFPSEWKGFLGGAFTYHDLH